MYCGSKSGEIYNDTLCHSYRRPETSRECSNETKSAECTYAWYAMEWGKVRQLLINYYAKSYRTVNFFNLTCNL